MDTNQKYASIDSAPLGFAVVRSPWITPLFLIVFGVVSAAIIFTDPWLKTHYITALEKVAGVNGLPEPGSLRVRPIFPAFLLTFWVFASGTWRQRLRLLLLMGVACSLAILLTDTILLRMGESRGVGPFSMVGDIIAGYAGLLALVVTLVGSVRLPSGVRTLSIIRRSRYYMLVTVGSIILAVSVVLVLLRVASTQVNFLRDIALLGGIGPGVVLFFPVILSLLAILGTFSRVRRANFSQVPAYSVGVVVPAYNEAEGIADCIRSLDNAAANYPGFCWLYLVDNGSTDGTVEVARKALTQCHDLSGQVLICPKRGKAAALNFGVAQTTEDIVMRLDADTLVSPSLLVQLAPYFSDPAVGIVGGIPLPKESSRHLASFLCRMRAIEVYYNIGFSRVAQGAIDAMQCVPGIHTAYRRQALAEAGGFAEGMNGEDTDMTVRIGRLGYRVIVDPRIHVFSEVPATWGHLREQRIRWSRSVLHVFARNMSAIWMRQGVRGLWSVPYSTLSLFRRMFMLLILIYGLLVALIDPSVLALRQGASLGALIIGPQFLLTFIVLLSYRRLGLIPFLPPYLGFRLFRVYIIFDMLFTLPLKFRDSPRKD